MLVRRFYDDRLAQASYLIGCQQTGDAIVIDPARDPKPYLDAARQDGVTIRHVTETHIHADFVSGARELAAATGAKLHLSGEGGPDWQYGFAGKAGAQLLSDGDVIELGGVRLEVWHTPGHTPEHLAFVVTDHVRSNEPVAMVSGDFLFVGDVGRPDLLEKAANVAGSMAAGARQLYWSLQRLDTLPDHLQIWPGHGAGSACGKSLGSLPSSTLGYERRTNWALDIKDESAFVAAVLDGQPTPPPYFGTMKQINRDGPSVLGDRDVPTSLEPHRIDSALRSGIVVDVRPASAYAAAHIPGTISIPLIKAFTKWAGWLIPYDRTLYLVAGDVVSATEARRALASIGLDDVAGYFSAAVIDRARTDGTTSSARHGDINSAASLQAAGRTVVDLREAKEWAGGHIPGAVHHPLGTIADTLADMDRNTPLAIHCQGGTRSAIAASVLEKLGFTDVIDLNEGYGRYLGE
jgi:hydroxyacylglutathione hydrolase